MQCRVTEVCYEKYNTVDYKHTLVPQVDKLRELFKTQFNFKTKYYEIPSDRWETVLHRKLADFCYEYDSPEDLAIIYMVITHTQARRRSTSIGSESVHSGRNVKSPTLDSG